MSTVEQPQDVQVEGIPLGSYTEVVNNTAGTLVSIRKIGPSSRSLTITTTVHPLRSQLRYPRRCLQGLRGFGEAFVAPYYRTNVELA